MILMIRILLDTNILVSGLLYSGKPRNAELMR